MVFESAEKPHFGDFSTFLYNYAGKFTNNIFLSYFFRLFMVACCLGELKKVKRRQCTLRPPSGASVWPLRGPCGAPRGLRPREAPVALASAVIYIRKNFDILLQENGSIFFQNYFYSGSVYMRRVRQCTVDVRSAS